MKINRNIKIHHADSEGSTFVISGAANVREAESALNLFFENVYNGTIQELYENKDATPCFSDEIEMCWANGGAEPDPNGDVLMKNVSYVDDRFKGYIATISKIL